MCAFVRSEWQLCASFRARTSSKQKSARFCYLREKKFGRHYAPSGMGSEESEAVKSARRKEAGSLA